MPYEHGISIGKQNLDWVCTRDRRFSTFSSQIRMGKENVLGRAPLRSGKQKCEWSRKNIILQRSSFLHSQRTQTHLLASGNRYPDHLRTILTSLNHKRPQEHENHKVEAKVSQNNKIVQSYSNHANKPKMH